MKNLLKFFVILTPLVFVGLFFVTNSANAQISNQTITLSPGWNIVSTPKVLSSHVFSAPETSTNFNIYLLDPTSTSGWQTMQGAGQTEFQPLYAYFVNNETGINQTLQFNYNFNLSPAQQLFQRTLQPGWNTVGIASPSYALPQDSANSADTNNPSNILNSITSSIGQVIDFTNGNTDLDSPAISKTWLSKTTSDANSLNDFRELKGYGVFVTNATNNYLGSENLQVTSGVYPVITLNGASTINLTVGASYTDAGATASDSNGDLTSSIIKGGTFVNTTTAGTYTITYNVSNSFGNSAQQVTRTIIVSAPISLTLTVTKDNSDQLDHIIVADKTVPTYGVQLAVVDLQAQGSAITVRKLPVTITVANGGSGGVNISALVNTLKLYSGSVTGTPLDAESTNGTSAVGTECTSTVTSTVCVVTFQNFTLTVPANGQVALAITGDFNSLDQSINVSGANVEIDVTNTNVLAIQAYDANNNLVTGSSYLTGSTTGNKVYAYVSGIQVASTGAASASSIAPGGSQSHSTVTMTIPFSVTAFGATEYIRGVAAAATVAAADNYDNFCVDNGTPCQAVGTAVITYAGNDTLTVTGNGNYQINPGQTRNFILQITTTASASASYRGSLLDVDYKATDDTTGFASFTAGLNSNAFKTPYVAGQ